MTQETSPSPACHRLAGKAGSLESAASGRPVRPQGDPGDPRSLGQRIGGRSSESSNFLLVKMSLNATFVG